MYSMNKSIKTIGIVGGGQLGRMLTQSAQKLGFEVVVLEAEENCPAAQVGATQIVGELYDKGSLQKLADAVDVITVEIEHFDTSALAEIEAAGNTVHPKPSTVQLIQDKFKQKEFLAQEGVPIADFVSVKDLEQATQTLATFGGSMMLKSRTGAYDGRGNAMVHNSVDLLDAMQGFGSTPLYAEKLIDFERELAVMVARSASGEVVTFPVTETIHERNICVETITPAQIKSEVSELAEQVAKNAVDHLEGAGMFGVEMFVDKSGQVIVNEIVPRVHNSGHYSMDACETGQFEQHIRAITGMELGSTNLLKPAASMINILGERDGETLNTGIEEASSMPNVFVHTYGKSPTKVDRKMGHINVIGDTVEMTRKIAIEARSKVEV